MGSANAETASTETAYKSEDCSVMAAYRLKNKQFREHHERAFEQLRAWGLGKSKGFMSSDSVLASRARITGVLPIEGEEPPAGWRVDRDSGAWVPKLTTRLGKALLVEFAVIQPPLKLTEGLPGMAAFTMIGNRIYRPGMFVLLNAMYLHWGGRPNTQEIDPQVWTSIKMSEWYLAKEAHDEKAAAEMISNDDF